MSEWSRDSVVNPIFEPGDGWRMGISIGHWWRPQVEKPAPKTLKQKAMALGGSPEFSSVLSFLCEDIRRYSALFSFWIQIQIMPLPWLPWRHGAPRKQNMLLPELAFSAIPPMAAPWIKRTPVNKWQEKNGKRTPKGKNTRIATDCRNRTRPWPGESR